MIGPAVESGLQAAAEASLFDTDVDSTSSSDEGVSGNQHRAGRQIVSARPAKASAPKSPTASSATGQNHIDSNAETEYTAPVAKASSQSKPKTRTRFSWRNPFLTLPFVPKPLISDLSEPISPATGSPLLSPMDYTTPTTPSRSRPRPRTRTRTRRSSQAYLSTQSQIISSGQAGSSRKTLSRSSSLLDESSLLQPVVPVAPSCNTPSLGLSPVGESRSEAVAPAWPSPPIVTDARGRKNNSQSSSPEGTEGGLSTVPSTAASPPPVSCQRSMHATVESRDGALALVSRCQDVSGPDATTPADVFWGRIVQDYAKFFQTEHEQWAQLIENGIPSTQRGVMWPLMSGAQEDAAKRYQEYLPKVSPYDEEIERDLMHTFPHHPNLVPGTSGYMALFYLLKAYALEDSSCGFCQGMQFLAGPLLLHMPPPQAFATLVALMRQFRLRDLFRPGLPQLQLWLYQLSRAVEDKLPRLHVHLVRIGVRTQVYASSWFMTMFGNHTPWETTYRIFDTILAYGTQSLFWFALLLLEENQSELLDLGFDDAVELLQQRAWAPLLRCSAHDSSPSTALFARAFALGKTIPSAQLDKYAAEWQVEQSVRMTPLREAEELRRSTWSLAAQVLDKEQDVASLQATHVELMKEVVASILAKEEVAEELVHYKTLYAHACLAHDQSLALSPSLMPVTPPHALTPSSRRRSGHMGTASADSFRAISRRARSASDVVTSWLP